MIYSSLSDDSIVFARWQGREAPGPHTSFLLPSGSSCLHLDRWSQSSGLALVHPVRWWGWGHFAYLSLENSQSVLWAQLVQKSFLQTHPTSIFSDATVSSPYGLRMPVIPNLKLFRVTSSLLCGTFAISNIIFSHPSWDRQKPLNFSCATRKALGNWCSHYLTGLGCHFHFVASFIGLPYVVTSSQNCEWEAVEASLLLAFFLTLYCLIPAAQILWSGEVWWWSLAHMHLTICFPYLSSLSSKFSELEGVGVLLPYGGCETCLQIPWCSFHQEVESMSLLVNLGGHLWLA